jgi:hypothetical protein
MTLSQKLAELPMIQIRQFVGFAEGQQFLSVEGKG